MPPLRQMGSEMKICVGSVLQKGKKSSMENLLSK